MSDVTVNAADWFAGMGSASQTGGGNWFTAGTYLCEVVSLSRMVSKDPKKKNARIIVGDLRVVEVIASLPADGDFGPSKVVGEVCAFYANLDSAYPSMDLGKVRGLIEAAAGPPEDTSTGAPSTAGWASHAARATEPPGTALAGARVIVQAGKTRTKAGKPIVTTTFSAAPDAAPDAS